jgi:hypothetical protein
MLLGGRQSVHGAPICITADTIMCGVPLKRCVGMEPRRTSAPSARHRIRRITTTQNPDPVNLCRTLSNTAPVEREAPTQAMEAVEKGAIRFVQPAPLSGGEPGQFQVEARLRRTP